MRISAFLLLIVAAMQHCRAEVRIAALLIEPGAPLADKAAVHLPSMTKAAEDHLPRGPAAFEIGSKGELILADPLRNRLVIFDSKGSFQREIAVGFAVDRIRETASGEYTVRRATTGATYLLRKGKPPAPLSAPKSTVSVATRTASGLTIEHAGKPPIRIEPKPGERLLSAVVLDVDELGSTHVLVESAPASKSSIVGARRSVQRFNREGSVVSALDDISGEQFIPSDHDVIVRRGRVYQLLTRSGEIVLKSWAVEPI